MTADECSVEERIEEIWRTGRELGLPDAAIHNVFTSVFREEKEKEAIRTDRQGYQNSGGRERCGMVCKIVCYLKIMTKFFIFLTTVCVALFIIVSLHNPTRKFVTRNIQDIIYPVMTTLRFFTLPLLTRYPHLSVWYTEECLVANMYFDQPHIDCTPCSENSEPTETSDLDNFTDMYYNNGKTVIVTDAMQQRMSWTDLIKRLDIHREVEMGAWKYLSKSERFPNAIEQVVNGILHNDTHIEWKINRLETLHIVRHIFPRLYFIPKETEVALHRFVFIDGPESDSYPLPLTEFANVVLIQGEGKSTLSLTPSPHCQGTCNSVTVTLDATQALFFNWIYWRPVRLGGGCISTLVMSSFY